MNDRVHFPPFAPFPIILADNPPVSVVLSLCNVLVARFPFGRENTRCWKSQLLCDVELHEQIFLIKDLGCYLFGNLGPFVGLDGQFLGGIRESVGWFHSCRTWLHSPVAAFEGGVHAGVEMTQVLSLPVTVPFLLDFNVIV
jgi:hypothetical protein